MIIDPTLDIDTLVNDNILEDIRGIKGIVTDLDKFDVNGIKQSTFSFDKVLFEGMPAKPQSYMIPTSWLKPALEIK